MTTKRTPQETIDDAFAMARDILARPDLLDEVEDESTIIPPSGRHMVRESAPSTGKSYAAFYVVMAMNVAFREDVSQLSTDIEYSGEDEEHARAVADDIKDRYESVAVLRHNAAGTAIVWQYTSPAHAQAS